MPWTERVAAASQGPRAKQPDSGKTCLKRHTSLLMSCDLISTPQNGHLTWVYLSVHKLRLGKVNFKCYVTFMWGISMYRREVKIC